MIMKFEFRILCRLSKFLTIKSILITYFNPTSLFSTCKIFFDKKKGKIFILLSANN